MCMLCDYDDMEGVQRYPYIWQSNNFRKAGFILHARVYARIRRLSGQLFILLSTVAPSAYARIRRLSPTKFKLVLDYDDMEGVQRYPYIWQSNNFRKGDIPGDMPY